MRLMFANLDVTERQVMQAFIVALNGQENRFSCQDHTLTQRGPLGGTPLVNGASQVGSALVIDGCTPSITGWGKAGDQFQVGNELKMLTADCNTDSGGATTLVFKPALRVSPADNAAIIVSSPKGLWMLSGPSNDWSSGAGVIFSDFTLDCVEDVLG